MGATSHAAGDRSYACVFGLSLAIIFIFQEKINFHAKKKILESINTHRVCALCCFDYGHAKRLSGSSRQSAPDGHGPRQYK